MLTRGRRSVDHLSIFYYKAMITHLFCKQVRNDCLEQFSLPLNERLILKVKCSCQLAAASGSGRPSNMRLILLTNFVVFDPAFYGPCVAPRAKCFPCYKAKFLSLYLLFARNVLAFWSFGVSTVSCSHSSRGALAGVQNNSTQRVWDSSFSARPHCERWPWNWNEVLAYFWLTLTYTVSCFAEALDPLIPSFVNNKTKFLVLVALTQCILFGAGLFTLYFPPCVKKEKRLVNVMESPLLTFSRHLTW